MSRTASIIFYLLIAAVTIYMASYVKVEDKWNRSTRRVWSNRIFLAGIFLVLFLCASLRFGIGNDYVSYTQTAHEAYVGGYVVTETGFNWLVRTVYTLFGGEYYEIVFALFSFATLFLFLKALYDQSSDFTLSFFLFMTLGMYFQTYNTVRYYFALSIALYSMRYVLQRDFMKFCAWILCAALFHKSILLVIPVYWIASYSWKKWQIAAGLVLSGSSYVMKDIVLKIALWLYPSYENTVYLTGEISITSIMRNAAILLFYIWFLWKCPQEQEKRREQTFYAQLILLSCVVYTFFWFLPVVTRIGYYFSVSQLLLIPSMVSQIQNKKMQKRIKAAVIVACVIYFLLFLYTAHESGVGLLPYRSWLFEGERIRYK